MDVWIKNEFGWMLQDKVDQETLLTLASLPECEDGRIIGFAEIKRSKDSSEKKRSKYQEFISECMKRTSGTAKERMKKCAEEWKKMKK